MGITNYQKSKFDLKKSIKNGWLFLETQNNNGFYKCYIGLSHNLSESLLSPPETSYMLITEVLLKHHPENKLTKEAVNYLKQESKKGLFTYFEDRNLYPPDSDVNSLGCSILFESGYISEKKANELFSTLLSNTNSKGIVQVWITNEDRPRRIDHVVATNIIYLAYLLGRDREIEKSKNWVYKILENKAYLKGSRYYNSPDAFLFALSKVIYEFPLFDHKFREQLESVTKKRIKKVEYPIDLAMLIIVAKSLGIPAEKEQYKLLSMQEEDGSWPANALFRFGSEEKYFGSKALTTAYAIRALEI